MPSSESRLFSLEKGRTEEGLASEKAHVRAQRGKSGKKVRQNGLPLKAHHPPQAAQHLRHGVIPGNGGHLSGGGCAGPLGRKHNEKALRSPGGPEAAQCQK